jgi:H+/Cl- antiporter ClcA/DMSO/TMAO reductase YedYZ molybdopterin-dependent catalytic subunit
LISGSTAGVLPSSGGEAGRGPRWFSPQPNVTGRGIVASYSSRFWLIVVVLGVVTGVAGSALMELLKLVEHAAWAYHSTTFVDGVRATPAWRHVAILTGAAVVLGIGIMLLARLPNSGGSEVPETLWQRDGRLALLPSFGRGALSIVTVGMGVSLGREAAPQLAGAATASRLADWAALPLWQRRLLVASGAGAGMAAVYNVPLGGALFALEVLLGTLALPLVLPALVTSVIATAVAWITLGDQPTYRVPTYVTHPSQIVWAALLGPIAGVCAVLWARAIQRTNRLRPRRHGRFVAPLVIFTALGALAIPYPLLLGNGIDTVQLASVGGISLGLLAILFVLKPLATAACLGSGSPGGLFTPTLTVGVLLGAIAGIAWSHLWPGAHSGSYALIGGAAFLAAAMQGPLSSVVLVLELTRHTDALMVPTLLAVAEATVVSRLLGAPSIYSARLGSDDRGETGDEIDMVDANRETRIREYGKRDDMLVHERDPFNAEPPRTALADAAITPLDTFYVRSHGAVSDIGASRWELHVSGLVRCELSLMLEDLRGERFRPREIVATLQCAGNRRTGLIEVREIPGEAPWGPGATGTARWRGVPLRDVLAQAGLLPDATDVALIGADLSEEADPPQSYGASIPLGKALAGEVLLAYEMNGQPLPRVHGAPVRVVVPGYIGARSVKWLERIEIRSEPWDGYFQSTAYRVLPPGEQPAPGRGMALQEVALNADFLYPDDHAFVPAGTARVGGYALAGGTRAISRVDVSPDGGLTWTQAELLEDQGPWAWRLWQADLKLEAGERELIARAWDSAANLQPERPESVWNTKGYVNNSWARIRVRVVP